jgi:hypothetical protein
MSNTHWYVSPLDDVAPEQLPQSIVWKRLRSQRNLLLTQTDFRVLPDAPWLTDEWASYRQALRDLPENTTDPREAVWPEPPPE